ncbi:hypothetical protein FRC14_007724 [Serendipita sp. 396]|nr:hypothetical protein FRC14_007724 [Serendipita sp. 396]KAG8776890.1 hypothetical protein FRC15_011657 [Serendipita sp. 397]KAG8823187.1 hypothetical protein FRC19_004438 [Serendipita sp. 401]KAG8847671.1 hypothetical protein FRB91_011530 [Serendipita sp. 411]KAG8861324.1 hypothetical protein FRC20_011486 [Serendipita sp. 405]KAG9054006.1 hypothetical protein FS842_006485 [Serendipita sp. 407]
MAVEKLAMGLQPIMPAVTGEGNINVCLMVVQFLIMICSMVGIAAGAGAVGSAILTSGHHPQRVLGVLQATRAGAVGAAVLGPGALVLFGLLFICCGGTVFGVVALVTRKERGKKKQARKEEDKSERESSTIV